MIKFNRPQSLDGALLIEELTAAGVKVKSDSYGITAPFIDGAGDLYLDIAAKDQAKAAEIVAAHQGSAVA
jgi:hypothetical protein